MEEVFVVMECWSFEEQRNIAVRSTLRRAQNVVKKKMAAHRNKMNKKEIKYLTETDVELWQDDFGYSLLIQRFELDKKNPRLES